MSVIKRGVWELKLLFLYMFFFQTKLNSSIWKKLKRASETEASYLHTFYLFLQKWKEHNQYRTMHRRLIDRSWENAWQMRVFALDFVNQKMNTSVHWYSNYEVFSMSILVSTEQRSRETKKTRGSMYSLVPQITKYIMESDRWPLRITDKR